VNGLMKIVGAGVGLAAMVASLSIMPKASADVPASWERRQNHCDTLSFYSQNPAFNDNLSPTHLLAGHKRLYYTTGPIEKGWVPVYSAGQEEWHTGWVRAECLVNGWPYSDGGQVVY
jgi:hypothetical protein